MLFPHSTQRLMNTLQWEEPRNSGSGIIRGARESTETHDGPSTN